jgi:hypothetical protein
VRVVVTSVDYADFLAVTLPAWRAFLPHASITVATSLADHDTQEVAAMHRTGVYATSAWTDHGARFNKARALDEAFAGTVPGQWCLALDADVYPMGQMPSFASVYSDVLYGCARYHCPTTADLEAHRSGTVAREALPLMSGTCRPDGYALTPNTHDQVRAMASKCLGYFQLFSYQPDRTFGDFPDNAPADKAFRQHFRCRVGLTGVYVLHLGEASRSNWTGRVVPSWGVAAHG